MVPERWPGRVRGSDGSLPYRETSLCALLIDVGSLWWGDEGNLSVTHRPTLDRDPTVAYSIGSAVALSRDLRIP